MPPKGTKVTFTEGQAKPKTWKGEVLGHDEEGNLRVYWPEMKYRGEDGVVCSHMFPRPWLVFFTPGASPVIG